MAEKATDATAIRPFTGKTPQADLDVLRARILARIVSTRWPEKETVDDLSQGTRLATIQALARYWAEEHDWRKCEEKLDALPHFVTEIDGLDIHFIHVRSEHEDAFAAHRHAWMTGLGCRAVEDHRATDQSDRRRILTFTRVKRWLGDDSSPARRGDLAEMSAEAPARYEIVVKDRLSNRFGRAFPGVEITAQPGRTVLTGEFRDQSQLHGLLDRLQDFGIELVSVNAIE